LGFSGAELGFPPLEIGAQGIGFLQGSGRSFLFSFAGRDFLLGRHRMFKPRPPADVKAWPDIGVLRVEALGDIGGLPAALS